VVVLGGAAGLPVGGAGHPLIAHWVGAGAVEVLLRSGLGFCLGGIHRRYAATVGLGVVAKGCAGGNARRASGTDVAEMTVSAG
jgi:hypothetical protein